MTFKRKRNPRRASRDGKLVVKMWILSKIHVLDYCKIFTLKKHISFHGRI